MDFIREAGTEREALGWIRLSLKQGEKALVLTPLPRRPRLIVGMDSVLTVRELEVVQCTANGLGMRGTAEKLNLSVLTIKSHLARIGRELGTGRKEKMVAICIRSGWIS